jgi:hypothetical protein
LFLSSRVTRGTISISNVGGQPLTVSASASSAKGAALAFYLSLITLLPGLALYLVGVAMSPSLSVVTDTWDIPLRIAAASLVMIVPTTLLMLLLSSLTREQRYATFGCYVLWFLGGVGTAMLEEARVRGAWYVLSPWHMQVYAQEFIFGLRAWDDKASWSLFALGAVALGSWPLLWRRISAPMRA